MATISFPEGTTFRVEFTVRDQQTQLPIDLTDATITLALYTQGSPTTGSVVPFLTKTLGSGLTVIDADAGQFRATFDPADTVDEAGLYDYEIELVESNGDVWLAGTGKFNIKPARRLDV